MGVPSVGAGGALTPRRTPAAMGRRLVGYGISLLAVLGITVAVGDIVGDHYPLLMRWGVALCLLAQILIVIDCLRPSADQPAARSWLWPVAVVATLGLLGILVGLLLAPAPWPGLEWRTNIWFGPVLQYFILLHARRRAAWVPFVLIGLTGWGIVTLVHQLDWRIQVLDLVFTITPMATLGIGGACITNLLMELRLSQLGRLRGQQDAQRVEMQEKEKRSRIRIAHDSVLHSLQQISRGWGQLSAAELGTAAHRAIQELQTSSQSLGDETWVPVRPALESALRDQGGTVAWRGRSVMAPAHVVAALSGAAREAVRNVVKHADGAATVHISRSGSGCRVIISDGGTGFDTTRATSRLGIRQAIEERMMEVGGNAVVASSPQGTSVRLEWPTAPLRAAVPFGPIARTLISWLPIPVLAASLIHISVFEVGPSAVGVAAIWLTAATVAVLGMRRLRRSGLAPWQPWVLTALSTALIVANYWWLPPEGTNGYHVWTPSLVGALMVIALPGRRLRHAVVMAVAVIGATFASSALSLGWETTLGAQFGSVMAVVMYVLAPLALATGASIIASHSRHTEELASAQRLDAELSAERDAMRRAWVARIRALCEPLLNDIASGALDPLRPSVQMRARILESRLRDELTLWPDGEELADTLHQLRKQGWDCTVDMAVNEPDQREEILFVVSRLPHPLPQQRLHLTHRKGRAVATVTTPVFTDEQWQHLTDGLEVIRDEDFTQIRSPSSQRHTPSRRPQEA